MKSVELKCEQTWHENGQVRSETYYLNGMRHNENGPAFRSWHDNGQLKYEFYYLNGNLHNPNGPALREWRENGQLEDESYLLNGKLTSKGEFEKRTVPSCSGRQVVIDGVSYILTPIKE